MPLRRPWLPEYKISGEKIRFFSDQQLLRGSGRGLTPMPLRAANRARMLFKFLRQVPRSSLGRGAHKSIFCVEPLRRVSAHLLRLACQPVPIRLSEGATLGGKAVSPGAAPCRLGTGSRATINQRTSARSYAVRLSGSEETRHRR